MIIQMKESLAFQMCGLKGLEGEDFGYTTVDWRSVEAKSSTRLSYPVAWMQCVVGFGLGRPRAEILAFGVWSLAEVKHKAFKVFKRFNASKAFKVSKASITVDRCFHVHYIALPPLASLLYAYVICHRSSAIGEV